MKETIKYSDFSKLDMRVGIIREVARIPDTDQLYKLQVDIDEAAPLQIVSSLVKYYTEEALLGARIIVLVNLKPTKFKGVRSEGMLLAAETENGAECVLLSTERPIKTGTAVT